MVLKNKLLKKENLDEIREKAISRGGHVQADFENELSDNFVQLKKKKTNFCLSIPISLLDDIDVVLEDRFGISKTGWIIEAIQEKLKAYYENKKQSK
jgi:hypothetical protein